MAKLTELDDAALVQFYIALRERRAKRKAAYEADDVDDKTKQDKIENELLRRLNERGADVVSIRGIGTAYRTTRSSASVADWDSLLDYVRNNDAWELLNHSVNKTAVEQFKAANEDLPPGVNWSSTVVVNFRRN